MANGRLGSKCIPAYKSCEVYQNSSGSEASVSIVVQGLDSSINNSITVAAGTTTYCISPVNVRNWWIKHYECNARFIVVELNCMGIYFIKPHLLLDVYSKISEYNFIYKSYNSTKTSIAADNLQD